MWEEVLFGSGRWFSGHIHLYSSKNKTPNMAGWIKPIHGRFILYQHLLPLLVTTLASYILLPIA